MRKLVLAGVIASLTSFPLVAGAAAATPSQSTPTQVTTSQSTASQSTASQSTASQSTASWAASAIARVTKLGVLGISVQGFDPQGVLTSQALASAFTALGTVIQRLAQPMVQADPSAATGSLTTSAGASLSAETSGRSPLSALDASSEAPVTIVALDSALVDELGLAPAAARIQSTLASAGLDPPAYAGSEAVARLLGLRADHPQSAEEFDLLPLQNATRAEAAYSFAQLLNLSNGTVAWVDALGQSFALPTLDPWQERLLTTAVSYIGYPYVWGGTSPTTQTLFGVEAPGGFDCSGFVWRVFKLTAYPGEGDLASVLRGRTAAAMSGEVPSSERVDAAQLAPGDVMFFGDGPRSHPAEIEHTAIYLGDGWLIQSSGQGVSLAPFSGWYKQTFAWARRPLTEAGLS